MVSAAKASGVGYLAIAYAVSRWLTRPSRGRLRRSPADDNLPCEALVCRTADGFRLAGWAVTPPRPRATVLLCHGAYNSREQVLGRIAILAGAGYRCVAFDFRGHGESPGRRTSFGYHEAHDVAAAAELIRQRWPEQPCAALGISMGAAAVCFAARRRPRFDAVILESLYPDIQSAFRNRLHSSYPAWFRRLAWGIIRMTEWRLGVRMAEVAPIRHIGELAPAPVLLLSGADDPHTPPSEVAELARQCRGPCDVWLVPGAGHADVYEKASAAYAARVLGFLDHWLAPAQPGSTDHAALLA